MTGNMMVAAMMIPEIVQGDNEEEKGDHVEDGGDGDDGFDDDDDTWSWARYVTPRKRRTTA